MMQFDKDKLKQYTTYISVLSDEMVKMTIKQYLKKEDESEIIKYFAKRVTSKRYINEKILFYILCLTKGNDVDIVELKQALQDNIKYIYKRALKLNLVDLNKRVSKIYDNIEKFIEETPNKPNLYSKDTIESINRQCNLYMREIIFLKNEIQKIEKENGAKL